MKKILSLFLVLAMCMTLLPGVVLASNSITFVSAEDVTSTGMTLNFSDVLDSQSLTINGTPVTATQVTGTQYKVEYNFALDTEYTVALDDETVYKFKFKSLYSDATERTIAQNNTVLLNDINDSNYILEIDLHKDNGSLGGNTFGMEVYKYTNGDTVTDAKTYGFRDYSAYIACIGKGTLTYSNDGTVGSDNLTEVSYKDGEGHKFFVDTSRNQVSAWVTKPTVDWTNGAKIVCYEENGVNKLVVNGDKKVYGTITGGNTSGNVVLKATRSGNLKVSGIKAYKLVDLTNIPTLTGKTTYLKDAIKLKFSGNATAILDVATYSLTDANGVSVGLTAKVSDYDNTILELVPATTLELNKAYKFTYNGDTTNFILKQLYQSNGQITASSSAQVTLPINVSDYVVEVTIDSTSKGRLEVYKYTNGATYTGGMGYAVRNYSTAYTAYIAAGKAIEYHGPYDIDVTSGTNIDNISAGGYKGTNIDSNGFMNFYSNQISVYLGSDCPWASGAKCIFYESNGVNNLILNGKNVVYGDVVQSSTTHRTSGDVVIRSQNVDNVILSNVTAYKFYDLSDDASSVVSGYANSNGIVLNLDNEMIIDNALTVTVDGSSVAPTVNGKEITIAYDFVSGKAYDVAVTYNGNNLLAGKKIKRTVRFFDDASGNTVTDKWSVIIGTGDETSSVKYESGKLVVSPGNSKQVVIYPNAFTETGSYGNQTLEYTMSVSNSNYDFMSLFMSESYDYGNTNASVMFVKYDLAGTRVKVNHHGAGDYWNANNTIKLTTNTDYNVIQTVTEDKNVTISMDGTEVLNLTDERALTNGNFAFRLCNNNASADCVYTIDNVKMYDLEIVDDVNITELKIEDGTIYANIVNAKSDATAVIGFYTVDNELLGCKIIENASGTISTPVHGATYKAKVYVWDMSTLTPLCRNETIVK